VPTCNTKKCKADTALSGFGNLSAPINWNKYPIQNAIDWFKFLRSKNVLSSDEFIRANGMLTRATRSTPMYGNVMAAVEYVEGLYDKYFPEIKQPTLFGKLSGYTATCRTFKRNRLGHRYCAKYAPTCGSAEEGCRTEPAPVPGIRKPKESKEFIPMDDVVKQIAKDMAYEYNERLDGARELMRKVQKYGGIAPYSGSYLREEYKDIPTKYKREEGVKLDELASELGFKDERSLVDSINSSEDEFNTLKEMQGEAKIRRFKTDDFLNMAYDRMIEEHGYTMSGPVNLGVAEIQLPPNAELIKVKAGTAMWGPQEGKEISLRLYKNHESLGFQSNYKWIDVYYLVAKAPNLPTHTVRGTGKVKNKAIDKFNEFSTLLIAKETKQETPVKKAEKIIAEKAKQMTLFGAVKSKEKKLWRHCAWCKRFLDKDNRYIPEPPKPYEKTDTICPRCQVKLLKECGLYPNPSKQLRNIIGLGA
jgi:hypothetical protein